MADLQRALTPASAFSQHFCQHRLSPDDYLWGRSPLGMWMGTERHAAMTILANRRAGCYFRKAGRAEQSWKDTTSESDSYTRKPLHALNQLLMFCLHLTLQPQVLMSPGLHLSRIHHVRR